MWYSYTVAVKTTHLSNDEGLRELCQEVGVVACPLLFEGKVKWM